MRFVIFNYGFAIERPNVKVWRGHKVPFILFLRACYPTGEHVVCNLIGPDFFEWCKDIHFNRKNA